MESRSTKRRVLSIGDKVRIIKAYESGQKLSAMCRELGLANSTVSTILKNKDKILQVFMEDGGNMKKIRKCDRSDVDALLLKWFKQCHSSNIRVTGPLLRKKALEFGKLLGVDFKCSNGWLERFKARHSISFANAKICGESNSVDENQIEAFPIKVEIIEEVQNPEEEGEGEDIAISKRRVLSIGDKVRIIKAYESGQKISSICREFGLVTSTVSTILKNKDRILQVFREDGGNMKKIRKCDRSDVDALLLKWFKQCHSSNTPVTRLLLKQKATEFGNLLGADFKCSNGWIDRFKARHSISLPNAKICDKTQCMDENQIETCLIKEEIIEQVQTPEAENNVEEGEQEGNMVCPTAQEAMAAAETLGRFFHLRDASLTTLEAVQHLQKTIEKIHFSEKTAQEKITDFFSQ